MKEGRVIVAQSVEVIFLGTGSGRPDPERGGSATLIGHGDNGFLIDAGEGVGRTLVQHAPEWTDRINTLVITHNHADHITGLPMLFMLWKAHGRTRPLDVWLPKGMGRALFSWLETIRLGEVRGWTCFLHRLAERTCTPQDGLTMEAWLNGHLPVEKDGSFGSYSLAVETEGLRIVHSSDINEVEHLTGRIRGADLFISESMHIDVKDVLASARSEGAQQVVLTHVPPGHPCKPVEGAVWAYDGMKLSLQDVKD
ncbi:MBL fold metallo-hydrolase [bacterium]|nr:MBL fold metallo-hydrolase [bacterium]